MALHHGAIADRNRVPGGTVDEAGWSAAAPASQALVLPLGIKARSVGPGTAAEPVVLRGTFGGRFTITYAALFATNLWQGDRVRLRLYADTAMTTVLYDSRNAATGQDRRVIPCLYGWRQLRWGDPNVFRGDLPPEDFALYPTNVHVAVPIVRAAAYRWDLVGTGYKRAPDNPAVLEEAGYLEVGHAWASDSLRPQRNYAWGGSNDWNPTDEVKRVSGGGALVEPGTGYRSVDVPLDVLVKGDGDRLFDLSRRVNWSKPVVWLPNADPADIFRYGFLGQRRDTFKKTWRHYRREAASIRIEEITT
ncbi:hypothetical protein [Azospirillum sp. A39]|uniref:hypothetical protein n=1 Tax=Azospirillum sp. A39 TaxID=3462279 RepID=UPI0040456B3A